MHVLKTTLFSRLAISSLLFLANIYSCIAASVHEHCFTIILIGVTVGFSQSLFTASEGDGLVEICAELLEGELGTDISLLVEV